MNKHQEQIQKVRARESYAKALRDEISKNIQTTMIGALDAFEQAFYPLLNIDMSIEDMTNEEADFYERWQQARRTILDLGNYQISRSLNTLSKYDVEQIQYVTEFLIKK